MRQPRAASVARVGQTGLFALTNQSDNLPTTQRTSWGSLSVYGLCKDCTWAISETLEVPRKYVVLECLTGNMGVKLHMLDSNSAISASQIRCSKMPYRLYGRKVAHTRHKRCLHCTLHMRVGLQAASHGILLRVVQGLHVSS